MTLMPEPGDPEASGQIQLAHHEARFRLPLEVRAGDVHPDVEALLALLMAQPFSTSVNMARGVSPELADAAAAMVGPTIGPVDPALTPRVRPAGGRVGLAYSGGVNSTAALAVLPADTVSCFLNRVDPPRGPCPVPTPLRPRSTPASSSTSKAGGRWSWTPTSSICAFRWGSPRIL